MYNHSVLLIIFYTDNYPPLPLQIQKHYQPINIEKPFYGLHVHETFIGYYIQYLNIHLRSCLM